MYISIANPTRFRQPLNSVRVRVCYIVQCFYEDSFTPALRKGDIPATCSVGLLRVTFDPDTTDTKNRVTAESLTFSVRLL